jgi:hypothetical protein
MIAPMASTLSLARRTDLRGNTRNPTPMMCSMTSRQGGHYFGTKAAYDHRSSWHAIYHPIDAILLIHGARTALVEFEERTTEKSSGQLRGEKRHPNIATVELANKSSHGDV